MKLRGFKISEDSDNIEDGVKRLKNHLLIKNFSIDNEAKIAASKAFFLSNLIKNNKKLSLAKIKYSLDKIELLKNISLKKPYQLCERLKAIVPEAFYYIWQGSKK